MNDNRRRIINEIGRQKEGCKRHRSQARQSGGSLRFCNDDSALALSPGEEEKETVRRRNGCVYRYMTNTLVAHIYNAHLALFKAPFGSPEVLRVPRVFITRETILRKELRIVAPSFTDVGHTTGGLVNGDRRRLSPSHPMDVTYPRWEVFRGGSRTGSAPMMIAVGRGGVRSIYVYISYLYLPPDLIS